MLFMDPPSPNTEHDEDLKVHGHIRNRKRVAHRPSDGDLSINHSVGTSNEIASKRRRLDSDNEEEGASPSVEQTNGHRYTTAASSSRSSHAGTSSQDDDDIVVIGHKNGKSKSEEDPWSRLEEYMGLLTKQFPSLDPLERRVFWKRDAWLTRAGCIGRAWFLTVQDALVQNDVSLMKARRILKGLAGVQENDSDDDFLDRLEKPIKKAKESDDELSDEEGKFRLIRDNLYDSEDSDVEEETTDRSQLVKFLQEATLPDLVKLKGLSERKATYLIQARPFLTWKQMIHSIKAAKHLSLDTIVEAATDYLNCRTVVSKIIRRCQKLANKVEKGMQEIVTDTESLVPPKMIAKGMKLQGYQLVALQWLKLLQANKMNGILADEMGLGKTIQSIAFIAHLLESGLKGPFLIIAPASTIDNWDDEFRRWTPSIRTVVYHGSLEDRAFLRAEYFTPKGQQKMEVVITTYDGATRNVIDKAAFKRLQFTFAIFDEAHLLKNMATQKYAILMKTIRTEGRLLLTGTPVQNNLTELLSLLVFAMPQMLARETDSLQHAFTYISKEGSTPYETQQVSEAKAILKPFILRRTKEDVALELPGRTSTIEKVPMSKRQKVLYEKMFKGYSKEIPLSEEDDEEAVEVGDKGLAALHQLRKLANHPLLIRNVYSDDMLPQIAKDLIKWHPTYKNDTAKPLVGDLEYMSDFQIHKLCMVDKNLRKHKIESKHVLDSGKFEYFDTYLPLLKEEEHRVLLFSQYVQVLDIVEAYLEIRKHKFARIDGSTPVGERQDIVDRFNTDDKIFIMLLSTRAGGLGINLTGADTVIIHDIDFNPYNDKQAENRCHRLGQKKEVSVFRLISKGTIEEQIFEMGQKKLQLEKNVMDEAGDGAFDGDGEVLDKAAAVSLLKRTFSSGKE